MRENEIENMKLSIKSVYLLAFSLIVDNHVFSTTLPSAQKTPLIGSYGHDIWIKDHAMSQVGRLDSAMILTLTLVTGSLDNTQLVASYYESIEGLTLFDRTDMHLKLSGSVEVISQVFNTSFSEYTCDSKNIQSICYASNTEVSIPASLQPFILGIIGLEKGIITQTSYIVKSDANISPQGSYTSFLGNQVAQIYGFPDSDGSGVRVGIVTFGGYFNQSDLDEYFSSNNLGTAPKINIVFVNNATMDYNDYFGKSVENYMDVEIIASVVPKANITFYFTPNDDQGLYDMINTILQHSDVVSLSWGHTEESTSAYWKKVSSLIANYSNVPVFAATGDSGSKANKKNISVNFPASSPFVISVGGTSLNQLKSGSISSVISYVNETAWSGSGGGYSTVFDRPAYQSGTNPKRGLPDVACNADPHTGYKICYAGNCDVYGGKNFLH